MTTLEVGAIVNAANRKLLGGGGSASSRFSRRRSSALTLSPPQSTAPSTEAQESRWQLNAPSFLSRWYEVHPRGLTTCASKQVRHSFLHYLAIPSDPLFSAGECVVTDAFALPAQKIFHIVGPDTVRPLRMGNLAATPQEQEQQLRSCYETCLQKAVEDGLGSLVSRSLPLGRTAS